MDELDQMTRTRWEANGGRISAARRIAALILVLTAGFAAASFFLAPGLALAAALPSDATGAHAWIVDGGGEVAQNPAVRIEIMLEYIVLGIGAIVLALRIGKRMIARLQDWYEGEPLRHAKPVAQPIPELVMPRPGHGPARAVPANDRRELHAA